MSFRTKAAISLLLVLLGGTISGCLDFTASCPDALYEMSTPDPQVRLPQDESPHCYGAAEWWYYTGRLETQTGARFGVEAVIFHLPPQRLRWIGDAWIGHYAVLDESSGKFIFDQTSVFDLPPLPPQASDGFDLNTAIVQMRGGNGNDHLRCAMSDGRFKLKLTLSDLREPILHGGSGYVPYGSNGRSFYYSRPRMKAEGTLATDEGELQVAGDFWFDRQWGMDLTDPHQPWDWFSIRLDDGADIMLFDFPTDSQPVALGTYVPAEGPPVSLSADDFKIVPQSAWLSPHTGISYEVSWQVQIPSQGLDLTIVALHEDQELDARPTTLNVYYEGLCTVNGFRGTQPVTGNAYVEQANAGKPSGSPNP